MAVREVPQKFTASDGTEFVKKEDAERYDTIITVRERYEDARRAYGRLLAETQKTADGQPFGLTILADYHHINENYHGMPSLETVSFTPHGLQFDERNGFTIIVFRDLGRGEYARREYKISDLYYSRANAERALLAAKEERIRQYQEDVAVMRARLYPEKAQE